MESCLAVEEAAKRPRVAHLRYLDVPNGASSVDRGCPDDVGVGCVPIERGERGTILGVLVL